MLQMPMLFDANDEIAGPTYANRYRAGNAARLPAARNPGGHEKVKAVVHILFTELLKRANHHRAPRLGATQKSELEAGVERFEGPPRQCRGRVGPGSSSVLYHALHFAARGRIAEWAARHVESDPVSAMRATFISPVHAARVRRPPRA